MTRNTTERTPLGLACARELRRIRRSLSLSYDQAADATDGGVARPTIVRIESGQSPLTVDGLARLCQAYGVHPSQVVAAAELSVSAQQMG